MSVVVRRYGRLREWVEERSVRGRIVVTVAALAVLLGVVEPLADAALGVGPSSPTPYVALKLLNVTLAVTAYYVLYVCARSFLAEYRRRRETPLERFVRNER